MVMVMIMMMMEMIKTLREMRRRQGLGKMWVGRGACMEDTKTMILYSVFLVALDTNLSQPVK